MKLSDRLKIKVLIKLIIEVLISSKCYYECYPDCCVFVSLCVCVLGLLGAGFQRLGSQEKLRENALQHLFDVSQRSTLTLTHQ